MIEDYGYYVSKYTGAEVDAAIGAVLEGRAVLVTNCPNCGAPIEHGKCPYCGTKFLMYDGHLEDKLNCKTAIASNVYDKTETYHNCTVEVWRNSQTGDTSVGWYKND